MSALGSAFADDPGTDYLGPDGEDQWGTAYTIQAVPQELWEILNDSGAYASPSFLNQTVWRGGNECWVVDQDPTPNAIVSCPQTVAVQLTYTCDGSNQFQAVLPIELIDITPPQISITLVESHIPHVTFGNVPRYPANAEILPLITISDPCGVDSEELLHNGQPYQDGTLITGVGVHILHIEGVDFSGNSTVETVMFEIRERPSYTADVEIESGGCIVDDDGQIELVEMTLVVSSTDFATQEVLLSSVRLLALDANGSPLNTQPVSIKDALLPGSNVLDHENIAATIGETGVRAYFELDFRDDPLVECPSEFIVLGVGHDAGQVSFEFGAMFSDVHDVLNSMTNQLGWDPGGADGPGMEPPAPCTPNLVHILGPSDVCTHSVPTPPPPAVCLFTANSSVTAVPNLVRGSSKSTVINGGGFLGCTTTSSCLAQSFIITLVQFNGNCCDCTVSYNATASVDATAAAWGFGPSTWTASATGEVKIGFAAPCDSSLAVATITATMNGPGDWVTAPPPASGNANVNCAHVSCIEGQMLVGSSIGFVETFAGVGGSPMQATFAEGWVKLRTLGVNVEVTPFAIDCDEGCDPDDNPDCPMEPE